MPKILLIVGPTGSGKTALALHIARHIRGALINADSRQVYKGLDIISGKDLEENSEFIIYNSELNRVLKSSNYSIGYFTFENTVPIFLLDVVFPTDQFSVSDFVKIADVLIPEVAKNYTPIIIGGTGYYINALFKSLETIYIPPDQKLREKLQSFSVQDLHVILSHESQLKLDSMNKSDRKNKRRLIRAIEISRYQKAHGDWHKKQKTILHNFDILKIGLKTDRETLRKRIDYRVQDRLQNGAIDEAKNLFQQYDRLSYGAKDANGYKQLFQYFKGELSLEKAIQEWKFSEYYNAKKQTTWFRKDPAIHWFDISVDDFLEKATKFVLNWYNGK